MKRSSLIRLTGFLMLVAALQSCTKNFEDINTDPTKPITAPPDALITGAEKAASDVLYNNYVNGKVGMLYAQFWSQTQKESDSQYLLDEGSNNALWGLYSSALSNLAEIVRLNQENSSTVTQNEVAIANILSVWIYQVLADVYGNIPYRDALKGLSNFTPKYDDAKAVYDSLLQKLDAQVALFDSSKGNFKSGEVIYNGDITKWKKLANSLKLRIGIRMADADPAKSKQVVEAAVQAGVILTNDDNALFPYLETIPDQFPFNEASGAGIPNDYVVSETLVKFMQSNNDPRLPVYARPASSDNSYKGKPYGIGSFQNDFIVYSYPGTRVYAPDFPGIIMTAAEVQFALAEAAARGYNVGGTAEDYYRKGIQASMEFWKIPDAAANAYLAQVPYKADEWRNCIGTQKWLALYMQGLQAWFERVRLNFEKPGGDGSGTPLFEAPAQNLDPSVKMVPYRLTYPITEGNINRTNYQQAAQAIGGDTKGTKLWWNKQ
jgi:hypothetical protein